MQPMAAKQKNALTGLAQALVQQSRLTEADAEACASGAGRNKSSFVEQLVASGHMGANEVAAFAASTFGYPCSTSRPLTNRGWYATP